MRVVDTVRGAAAPNVAPPTRAELLVLVRRLARAGLSDHAIAEATDLHVCDVRRLLAPPGDDHR